MRRMHLERDGILEDAPLLYAAQGTPPPLPSPPRHALRVRVRRRAEYKTRLADETRRARAQRRVNASTSWAADVPTERLVTPDLPASCCPQDRERCGRPKSRGASPAPEGARQASECFVTSCVCAPCRHAMVWVARGPQQGRMGTNEDSGVRAPAAQPATGAAQCAERASEECTQHGGRGRRRSPSRVRASGTHPSWGKGEGRSASGGREGSAAYERGMHYALGDERRCGIWARIRMARWEEELQLQAARTEGAWRGRRPRVRRARPVAVRATCKRDATLRRGLCAKVKEHSRGGEARCAIWRGQGAGRLPRFAHPRGAIRAVCVSRCGGSEKGGGVASVYVRGRAERQAWGLAGGVRVSAAAGNRTTSRAERRGREDRRTGGVSSW
ncbi:hypothetical protein BC628DRAFT_214059 [Trametes gibbosa]|nr:hypothetical protein BC628DRAFT_214059 [Trametes gibbosa]